MWSGVQLILKNQYARNFIAIVLIIGVGYFIVNQLKASIAENDKYVSKIA